tara:strand:+ start:2217 stop:4553 length:2337 start_codon:yes stop_codon:yes gene_type:complete
MPTPALIARQIKLETQQVEDGIAKLHANINKADARQYTSSTVHAQKLIKQQIPVVAKEIDRIRKNRLMRGTAGPALAPLIKHTMGIESNVLAMITLKILFDVTTDPRDRADLANNVIDKVGIAVEQEAKWRFFNEKDPELLRKITYCQHKGKGLHYKDYNTTKQFKDAGKGWDNWPRLQRVKIGAAFCEAAFITGYWSKINKREGPRRSVHIQPTPALMVVIDGLIKQAELFAPFNWPMLCEPNDWTNEVQGGYYTNQIRKGNKLIRTFGQGCIQGEIPLKFLNHLQKVAYKINLFILDVANTLEEKAIKIESGKFVPEDTRPLPNKPVDIDTNPEANKNWRKEAAKIYDYNSTSLKRCIRTKLTLSLARKFSKEERYYLPASYDYRGRVYFIPSFLTPHDTCFGKSLIQFADGQPINERTEYWVNFQLATTYGLSKATMEERQAWVEPNLSLIKACAEDPIGNITIWEGAEEPFLFLAACEEYYALFIAKTRKLTTLAIAVDATCSGLQVLAGMSHDRSTAELVNVLPGDKPSDAYKAVANKVNEHIPKEWGIEMTRSRVKRVVMTIPYNARTKSNRTYIREALEKEGVTFEPAQLTEIVRLTRQAMEEIVPGPMQVMNWLNKEIGGAIRRGQPHIEWTTPSGFKVKQDLRKINTERVQAHLMGKIELMIGTSMGEPDRNHHKNAGAPNLIHSVDASILHIGLKDFSGPFTVIHDSVLCLANQMDEMNKSVRAAYAKCFTDHSPLHDLAESINAETEPPMVYTFDPATVTESDYFFC